MRTLLLSLTCAAALALGGRASASIVTFNFDLDGFQEVPVVNTTGTGTATVTLDTVTGLLTWAVTYSDLLFPSTAAHFHGPALPGQNAGILVDMGAGQTFGVTSGTLNGSATITAMQVQQVLDGLWYINVHSTGHPGGEIRGQVVPAPGALALLGIGAFAAVRRRRRM